MDVTSYTGSFEYLYNLGTKSTKYFFWVMQQIALGHCRKTEVLKHFGA